MKISKLKSIVLLCLCGMIITLFSCQKEETSIDNTTQLAESKVKKTKINVCHNDHVINISSNAVSAHQRHGDAVDMDGDGYFDMDNSCGETDCNDNDPAMNPSIEGSCDDGDLSTAELLLGTWTTLTVDVNTSVGGQSVTDYLIDVVGMSEEDAAAQSENLLAELEAQVTGELTLNSDLTYESYFDGGSDSGTWILSEDEQTLTLFEGPDLIVIHIIAISEHTWVSTHGDDILYDLDGDARTPDVVVTAEANITMTK